MNNNELTHYGIRGMRWGTQRAQARGVTGKSDRRSADAKESGELLKKKSGEMSNAELRKLNERQQLERTHVQLNPSRVKRGVAFVTAAAGLMGTVLNLYNNSDKIVKAGKNIVGKMIK